MPIKISIRIFLDLYEQILKFTWKREGPKMASMTLKNKEGRVALAAIEAYCGAIDRKGLEWEQADRPVGYNRGPRSRPTCV